MYLYAGDPDVAIPFASTQNDALAKYCSEDASRLFFMPTLPLQDIDSSVKEFDRAMAMGGKALNIACFNIAGRDLDDEYFFPIYEKCAEADIPLMLHPEPMLVFKDAQPWNTPRMLLDYVYQDTFAPLSLMTGGVFDTFPNLKIYITHGGGFLPYQFKRFEIFASLDKKAKQKKPLREYMPNIYVDILVHDLKAREFLVDFIGVDNIVMGDNYEGTDSADGFAFVEEMNLSQADKDKINGGNAKKLFKLP
jgi:aminocarboxymuconate-semialdehyde decarboxylase